MTSEESIIEAVPTIIWRDRVDVLGRSAPGMGGYVGKLPAPLFSYGYSGGLSAEGKPWRLTSSLPGYAKRQWTFGSEKEAQAHAWAVLARWLHTLMVVEEAVEEAADND